MAAGLPGMAKGFRPTPISHRINWIAWLWLLPAFIFIAVYLIYPVIDTFRLSVMNANSTQFVGIDNYSYIFTNKVTQDLLLITCCG
jgi:ABC-type sugar transport system permease subunit